MASMVLGGLASAAGNVAGSARDTALAVGEAISEEIEEGAELLQDGAGNAVDAIEDGADGLMTNIGQALGRKKRIQMDVNHHVFLLPSWVVYAFSATGIVGFLATYGRTVFCCYWPLSCCGGCVASMWNQCFRKMAFPCCNEFMHLTVTINRIVVHQTRQIAKVRQAVPRNLKVGLEYGAIWPLGAFSTWQVLRTGRPEQPLETVPQQLAGGTVYFETRKKALPKVQAAFESNGSSSDSDVQFRWQASQAFHSSYNLGKSKIVPAGWSLKEIRSWQDGSWQTNFDAEACGDKENPNDIVKKLRESDTVKRVEFSGRQEGSASWPFRQSSSGLHSRGCDDVLTFTHWGDDEDLVLVLQICLERHAVMKAAEIQKLAGTKQGMLEMATQKVLDTTHRSARMLQGLVGENPDKAFEVVRVVNVEIRPDHLEMGPTTRNFRGFHQLLHCLVETSASRGLNSTLIRLRRCRVEVAPGRGPLKGKTKVVGFVVPRNAFIQPLHPRSLDVQTEVSRIDVFQGQGSHDTSHHLRLTVPLRPGDRFARLVLKPETSWAENASLVARRIPLAGATISRVISWVTGAERHNDELFCGAINLYIRPQPAGSSVTCEVAGQGSTELTASELAPPGTVSQTLEVPALSSQDQRCSYGLEFRLESSVSQPVYTRDGWAKTPRKVIWGWSVFGVGLLLMVVAIMIFTHGRCILFVDDDVTLELKPFGVNVTNAFNRPNPMRNLNLAPWQYFYNIQLISTIRQGLREMVINLVEGLQEGHVGNIAEMMGGAGIVFILVSLLHCSSGTLCLDRSVQRQRVYSSLLWILSLSVVFLVVSYSILFFLEIEHRHLWDKVTRMAIIVGVTLQLLLVLIFVLSFWELIRGVCCVAFQRNDPSRNWGDGPFHLHMDEFAAEELNYKRHSSVNAKAFVKKALAFDPLSLHRNLKRIQQALTRSKMVSLPIWLRKGQTWEDELGRYYMSEHLRTTGAVSEQWIGLEDFRNSIRQLHNRGVNVSTCTSHLLFESLRDVRDAATGSKPKPRRPSQTGKPDLRHLWTEERLTEDAFKKAWDANIKDDAYIKKFKSALIEKYSRAEGSSDEAWKMIQVSGVVPLLVSNWKQNTRAACDEEDGWGSNLKLVVTLKGDDRILTSSVLHAKIKLRYLGREMGHLCGSSPTYSTSCTCPGFLPNRTEDVIYIDMDASQAGEKFDEYEITFLLARSSDDDSDFAAQWWMTEFRSSMKSMRVGWQIYLGGTPLESDFVHSLRAGRMTGVEGMETFRWHLPSQLETVHMETSMPKSDMEISMKSAGMHDFSFYSDVMTEPVKRFWWPVSEYRRVVHYLGEHHDRNAEHGMAALDILPLLKNFQTGSDGPKVEPTVSIPVHVESLLKRQRPAGQCEFNRIFDRHTGWKARATIGTVSAGWVLESMEVKMEDKYARAFPHPPWKAQEGGDPTEWLRSVECVSSRSEEPVNRVITLIGRRYLVLDAHGLVHELSSSTGRMLSVDEDEEEKMRGMAKMEVHHMLRDLLSRLQISSNLGAETTSFDLTVPLQTKLDCTLLQRARNYGNKLFTSSVALIELSQPGLAVPTGLEFVRAYANAPKMTDFFDLDEMVEVIAKKGGLTNLPATAIVRITKQRLQSVPKEPNQILLHFMVVARVFGFDPSIADAKHAITTMTRPGSTPYQQHLALECLVRGEQWPLQVTCGDGDEMTYHRPWLSRFSAPCNHCEDQHASTKKYYCSKCQLVLCEVCAIFLDGFKNDVRNIQRVLMETEDDGFDDDASTVISDTASMASMRSLEDGPTLINKLIADNDFGDVDGGELLGVVLKGPGPLEAYLQTFMPVRGLTTCGCGCKKKMRWYKWRNPWKRRTCIKCKEPIRCRRNQFGCPFCPCALCTKCCQQAIDVADPSLPVDLETAKLIRISASSLQKSGQSSPFSGGSSTMPVIGELSGRASSAETPSEASARTDPPDGGTGLGPLLQQKTPGKTIGSKGETNTVSESSAVVQGKKR